MQDAIRNFGTAARLIVAATLLFVVPPGRAASTGPAQDNSFQQVAYDDGSSWRSMELATGSVEGPGGGATPVARLKADLGGPKTYFLLAGPVSELAISIARPRFRFAGSEGMARRVQLAQFEVTVGARRTTVQIGNGPTVFKRGSELEVSKVTDGVWEVRPKKSLQPGEYALVLDETGPVADFTIVERGY